MIRFEPVLNVFSVLLLLFFSVYLFTSKQSRSSANYLLGAFLTSQIFFFLPGILAFSGLQNSRGMTVFWRLTLTVDFLMGPLLYLYLRVRLFSDRPLSGKDRHHFFFPTIYLCLSVLAFLFLPVLFPHLTPSRHPDKLFPWMVIISHTIMAAYAFLAIRLVQLYAHTARMNTSTLHHLNLRWIFFLTGSYFILWTLIILSFLIRLFLHIDVSWIRPFIPVYATITILSLIYIALNQPVLFSATPLKVHDREEFLPPQRRREYLGLLKKHMNDTKPHLIQSLTLDQLASRLELPPKTLSFLINRELNCSFFDFINSYRVAEAQSLLLNSSSPKQTHLSILYEAGFNSKATFNRAFYKHAGMSPREYKARFQPQNNALQQTTSLID